MGTEHLGGRIRDLRKAKSLTLQQLCRLVAETQPSLTPDKLSRVETGQRRLAADEAQSIAGALGVSISALYGEDIPKSH